MSEPHLCQREMRLRDDDGVIVKTYRCNRLIGSNDMYCDECHTDLNFRELHVIAEDYRRCEVCEE